MENNNQSPQFDLYIFHSAEDVVLGLYLDEKMLGHRLVPKRELGEKWVENFEAFLSRSNATIEDLKGIYLNNSFSTWNASRLITLFVKTIICFKNIPFYLREESQDKFDIISALKSFCKHRKSFRKVDNALEIAPLYKKCPNINI